MIDAGEAAQKHVLFIDDSPDDQELYSFFLSRKGFRVTAASDGLEGVEKATQLQPDLILMDLWLPLLGGWAATRRLKGDERTRHIPVVVITGHGGYLTAEAVGAEGFLAKPCTPEDLYVEVLRVLAHKDNGGQSRNEARS